MAARLRGLALEDWICKLPGGSLQLHPSRSKTDFHEKERVYILIGLDLRFCLGACYVVFCVRCLACMWAHPMGACGQKQVVLYKVKWCDLRAADIPTSLPVLCGPSEWIGEYNSLRFAVHGCLVEYPNGLDRLSHPSLRATA